MYTGVRGSVAESHQAHTYDDSIRDEEHVRSPMGTYLQHARYATVMMYTTPDTQ
jgi:hypothetical protein